MACDYGLFGDQRSLEARLPPRMRDVRNDSDTIQLLYHTSAKVAEPSICSLSTAIANNVAAVICEVHHANAELKKNADISQLLFFAAPLLRKRNAVAGKVKDTTILRPSFHNVVRRHGLSNDVRYPVRCPRKAREAFQ